MTWWLITPGFAKGSFISLIQHFFNRHFAFGGLNTLRCLCLIFTYTNFCQSALLLQSSALCNMPPLLLLPLLPLCDWTMNVSGSSGWLASTVSAARDCTSFLNVCLSGPAIDFDSVRLYYSCFPLCLTSNTHIQTQTLSVSTRPATGSLVIRAGPICLSLAHSLVLIKSVRAVFFYLSLYFSALIPLLPRLLHGARQRAPDKGI